MEEDNKDQPENNTKKEIYQFLENTVNYVYNNFGMILVIIFIAIIIAGFREGCRASN